MNHPKTRGKIYLHVTGADPNHEFYRRYKMPTKFQDKHPELFDRRLKMTQPLNAIEAPGIYTEISDNRLVIEVKIDKPHILTAHIATKFAELTQLFDGKQKDYGSNNISKFGRMGVGVRMNDKWERIMNITHRFQLFADNQPDPEWVAKRLKGNNESLRDSYKDLAVYSVIDWMLEDGEWE